MEDNERKNPASGEREEIIKKARSFERSPWVFLVRRSKLTYLIIIFLLIFGLLTISRLPKELNPEVEIPIAVVVSAFPGASPADVEEQVTKVIENKVKELSGVKMVNSTASLGVSSTVVEFEAGEDLTESIRKLKDSVDLIDPNDLPEDATEPEVIEINIDDQSIFVATLSSEKYDVLEIKEFAENIEDELTGIPFVSDVRIVGGRDRIIRVDADQFKLAGFGISMNQVIGAIEANNFDFPLGSVEIDDLRYSARVVGEFSTAQEIAKIPIAAVSGKPVLLEDVASVSESLSDESSRSRLSTDGSRPVEAVSIQVFKKTGGDITSLAEEVRKRIENGRGIIYPSDLQVEITRDFSEFVEESIDTLSGNGIGTVVIILLLLFIFLGWREALIAGLAVPFSFFISFIFMALIGESLNFLSLFSLVLALGLLVDSAVVIVEGMFKKVSEHGVSGYWAAISTIQEYAAPLLSGMLTTVAAFFPLLFVIGVFGQFIRTIPIVVSSTLIAALFVALTIIPSIGAIAMKPKNKERSEKPRLLNGSGFRWLCRYIAFLCRSKPHSEHLASKMFAKASERYHELIPEIIASRRRRRTILFGVIFIFLVSIALPILGFLNVESFPSEDQDFFFIEVELPNGTLLEETDSVIREIEKVLVKEPQIVNFVSNAGATFSLDIGGQSAGTGQENQGFVEINLVKKGERDVTSIEISQRIREKLRPVITNATVRVVEAESGPPTGEPVQVRVKGEDLLVLEDIAEKIKSELEEIPTTINVKTSVELSSGEVVFVPNKDLLVEYGLSVAQIGSELRSGIARDRESDVTRNGDEIIIDIGYKESLIRTVSDLKGIPIRDASGGTVFLSELGRVNVAPSLASISRRDNERVVSVTGGTEGGNPTEITQELERRINENIILPAGFSVEFGGEQEELQEVFTDMFIKMIIGIILIIFILVTQFNSYRQVLIIIFTIPLAMIGVFLGMTAARLTLDIPSFIGIVSLAGIVVNNAIILLDQINRELEEGKELVPAVQEAGYLRLRPIVLTTVTTVFGLLPLSISQPLWRNMGFAIIFGLLFSTLLTLFVVPTMYVSFYKKQADT